MSTPGHNDDRARAAEVLPTAECWRLIESADLGRLAVTHGDGAPDVFPLNYLAHQGRIYLRSGPGRKLRSLLANPAVALEVDGEEGDVHWSVVVRGTAAQVEADSEVLGSGAHRLVTDDPARKPHVIRIMPETVTGRRFAKRPTGSAAPGPVRGAPPTDAPGKPNPIPHFPPPAER
jgi:hypothetical protein